ncbi:MAG: class E sortase [Propionibacteriaceae bacterium]|nr:class E sortase [Propionibacteriaceae bacterium]
MTDPTPKRWTFRLAVALVAAVLAVAAALGWWWLWGAGLHTASQAANESNTYLSSCELDPGFNVGDLHSVDPDVTIGVLTMPGSSTTWPIRVGVSDAAFDGGVGWYQDTAAPGEVGNMAVVGQRKASGGAFDSILKLNTGDTITLQTCAATYTYTLMTSPRDLTVQSDDDWVLGAVPGAPNLMPTDAWLTLIANQDVLPSPDRAVGFAKLTATSPR